MTVRLFTTLIFSLLVGTACADPIHDAAKDGGLDGVQAQLDAVVNVKDCLGWSALLYAARFGHNKEIAELLGTSGNLKSEDSLQE